MRRVHVPILVILGTTVAVAAGTTSLFAAQQASGGATGAVTTSDYQRAEKFLAYNTTSLVFHRVRPAWLPDDRFWYRHTGPEGIEFVLFDVTRGTHQPAFDHAKVAAALSVAVGKTYEAAHPNGMIWSKGATG